MWKKIAAWVGIGIISLLCLLFISALLGRADIVGYRTYSIASGSMSPTLKVGDLVYVTSGDPKVGDIVVLTVDGTLIAHRIIARENGRLVTKGDANGSPDTFKNATVLGIVRFHVPYLGRLALGVHASLSDGRRVKGSIEAGTWETDSTTTDTDVQVLMPLGTATTEELPTSLETTTTTEQPPPPPETTTTTEPPPAPPETTTTTEQAPTPPGTTTTEQVAASTETGTTTPGR